MNFSVEAKSYAKINHYLRVFNKSNNNLHKLESVFQKIDLCDDMRFSITDEGISSADSCYAVIKNNDSKTNNKSKTNSAVSKASSNLKTNSSDSSANCNLRINNSDSRISSSPMSKNSDFKTKGKLKTNCKNFLEKEEDLKNSLIVKKSLYKKINIKKVIVEFKDSKILKENKENLLNENNLIIKAIDELLNIFSKKYFLFRFKNPACLKISVKKNIPLGAGLGGGSTNAATTVLSLIDVFNECIRCRNLEVIKEKGKGVEVKNVKTLKKLKLLKSERVNLGLRLGSDVNFFLSSCNCATVKNSGEKVHEAKAKKGEVLLRLSNVHASTKKIYEKFDELRSLDEEAKKNLNFKNKTGINNKIKNFTDIKNEGKSFEGGVSDIINSSAKGNKNSKLRKTSIYINDLEEPFFYYFPEFKKIKENLKKKYSNSQVILTGSGSTIIVLLSKKDVGVNVNGLMKVKLLSD